MRGWVKLHREIRSSAVFQSSQVIHVWLYLLLSATHKDHQQLVGYKVIDLKPGQLVTGRKAISKATGINESTVERALKSLEKLGNIEQQTNSRFRVISITNWHRYQESEQQENNKRTTREQQENTNKNIKNIKNIKKETHPSLDAPSHLSRCKEELKLIKTSGKGFTIWLTDKQMQALATKLGPDCTRFQIRALAAWFDDKPKEYKNKSSHYRTILNWHKREVGKGMEFAANGPDGAGYYYQSVLDRHYKINEAAILGVSSDG